MKRHAVSGRKFPHPENIAAIALAAVMTASVAFADAPAKLAPTSVAVNGENGKSLAFDTTALDKLPQHAVHGTAHGKTVDCSGVNLLDLLGQVGAPSGEALRGKNLSLYVRVRAADGYQAVFALAELDPGMRDNVPVLTHQCNGNALDAKDGPLRVVAPGDERPARWVRQVTAIDLLRAP